MLLNGKNTGWKTTLRRCVITSGAAIALDMALRSLDSLKTMLHRLPACVLSTVEQPFPIRGATVSPEAGLRAWRENEGNPVSSDDIAIPAREIGPRKRSRRRYKLRGK
jgi:hypothetical protein